MIEDINVEDPPLEEVISSLFLQGDPDRTDRNLAIGPVAAAPPLAAGHR
jgi:hypothetical protein